MTRRFNAQARELVIVEPRLSMIGIESVSEKVEKKSPRKG